MTPARARLEQWFADRGRLAVLKELDASILYQGPGDLPSCSVALLRRISASSSDTEIEAAIRGLSPSPQHRDHFARALGYMDYSTQRRADLDAIAAARTLKVGRQERYLFERQSFATSPRLSDTERALIAELAKLDHSPLLPLDCYSPDLDGAVMRDMRYSDGVLPDRVRRATGTIALLLEWHAKDRPRDLSAWLRRNYAAVVGLPLVGLPADERLMQLWTHYARAKGAPLLDVEDAA